MEKFSDSNIELLQNQPTISLEVFRHDEKDVGENDNVAPLTAKGRDNALKQGRLKNPKLNRGYVVASPRERALHSALLQFFGPFLSGVENVGLTELMEKTKQHENLVKTDERLNFHVESHPEFNERFYAEYTKKEGNDTLGFQLEKSDQLILDLAAKADFNDKELEQSISCLKGYKRMVGDLAEVFLEYFDKLEVWEKDYNLSPQDYDEADLQIFIGTHSQNVECFLLKILEMKEGIQGLREFLEKLPHRKSFIGYSEGFKMKIFRDSNNEIAANLNYQNFKWSLTKADLQKLINEKTQFDLDVKTKLGS